MESNGEEKKIAVVGGGISGIVAAHLLSKRHSVTLFEAEPYVGGHTNTIVVPDGPDAGTPVDTGFIVCNPVNYPLFYRFLDELGVPRQTSDMSFAFFCERTGLSYNGPTFREFLTSPLNVLKPRLLQMLWERRRFARHAQRDLAEGTIGEQTLSSYLMGRGRSRFFSETYIVPLSAAIWSSSAKGMDDFPALTFLRFFENHGILGLDIPRWETVSGGSFSYVKAFEARFRGAIRRSTPVRSVTRAPDAVLINTAQHGEERFDHVVLATHADVSLSLLKDPSNEEQRLLSTWRYHRNRTVLHTDASILPMPKRQWASWNYVRRLGVNPDAPLGITYYMNRLQRLATKREYFVSLNHDSSIRHEHVVYETEYTHPAYTLDSVKSQEALRALNGKNRTSFCGAYLGYGFHEDGARSGVDAVRCLGGSL